MKKIIGFLLTLAVAVSSLGMFACTPADGNPAVEYSITTRAGVGGTLTVSHNKVDPNGSVIFTITPDAGYVLKDFTLNGNSVEKYDTSFTPDQTTYELVNILRDYNAVATFVSSNASLNFIVENDDSAIADKPVYYRGVYGDLPTAYAAGKRFTGWKDAVSGLDVTAETVVEKGGTIDLVAQFVDITAQEKLDFEPHSATVAYYDMTATKYGVAWHVKGEPVNPVVQLVEGVADEAADFANAKEYVGTYKEYMPVEGFENQQYVIYVVLDDLDFNSTYSVRYGDKSADVWNGEEDSYKQQTFTTREEEVDVTKFFYMTDTQQRWHIGTGDAEGMTTTHWEQTTRDAMARFGDEAQFLIHAGDIFDRADYPTSYAQEMLGSMEDWLFNLPNMVVAGNHEDPSVGDGIGYDCVGSLYNIDYPDGEKDALKNTRSRGPVFSFELGPVHFVMLRSNDIFYADNYIDSYRGVLSAAQVNWMKQDVKKAQENPDIKWTVAVMHESCMRASQFTNPSTGSSVHAMSLTEQLVPLFNELNVDLCLFGHDHTLYASYPMIWDETIEEPEGLPAGWREKDQPFRCTISAQSQLDGTPEGEARARYVALRKARPATTTVVEKTLASGEVVDTFDYGTGYTGPRGVVWYQISTSGNQTSGTFKMPTRPDPANFSHQMLRVAPVNGGERYGKISVSMYSFIEISDTELTVRTYGVRDRLIEDYAEYIPGQYLTYNGQEYQSSFFVDGFQLSK
jgi:DNA repair exonuclease SbcCD nuclease subunit